MIDLDVAVIVEPDTISVADVLSLLLSDAADIPDLDVAAEGEVQPVIIAAIANIKSGMHPNLMAFKKRICFFIAKTSYL